MLADEVDYVVGVDTHRDEHVLAVVACPSGAVVAQQSVRASARGYAQALRFVEQHSGRRVWAVEGAGHYGAGLARHLSGRGETVLEIGRGPRDQRRLRGKDDSLDAIRAARTALKRPARDAPGSALSAQRPQAGQTDGHHGSAGAHLCSLRSRDLNSHASEIASAAARFESDAATRRPGGGRRGCAV